MSICLLETVRCQSKTRCFTFQELTFIVLARNTSAPNGFSNIHDISQMIGDVNLFFKGSPDDEDFEVEAEIMIAGSILIIMTKLYPILITFGLNKTLKKMTIDAKGTLRKHSSSSSHSPCPTHIRHFSL